MSKANLYESAANVRPDGQDHGDVMTEGCESPVGSALESNRPEFLGLQANTEQMASMVYQIFVILMASYSLNTSAQPDWNLTRTKGLGAGPLNILGPVSLP
jgi:hypothetical protein